MSNIEGIEWAVEKLPTQDFVRLAAWAAQRRQQLEVISAANGCLAARDHSAFLTSYAPRDEGLYVDTPAGSSLDG
jgi:hypothetical protein